MKIVCSNPNPITKGNAGPVSITYTRSRPAFRKYSDATLELYHALWRELHEKQDATPEWFSDWCGRVPQASCPCNRWLKDYIAENPPRYDDWPRYGWMLHCAVSRKLEKPDFSWDEFCKMYLKEDSERTNLVSCVEKPAKP